MNSFFFLKALTTGDLTRSAGPGKLLANEPFDNGNRREERRELLTIEMEIRAPPGLLTIGARIECKHRPDF